MNMRAKYAFSIGFLSLLCVILPGSLRAGQTLTYTGLPYSECQGTYVPSCSTYSLDITIDTTLSPSQLENLTMGTVAGGDIPSSAITNYSFTDGFGVDITPGNVFALFVDLATNGSGTPTAWVIEASGFTNPSDPTAFGCAESTPGAYAPCGSIFTDMSADYVSGYDFGQNGYAADDGGNGTAGTLQISGANIAAPEPASFCDARAGAAEPGCLPKIFQNTSEGFPRKPASVRE